MASLQVLAQRLVAVEARLAEVEGGYAQTQYKMNRKLARHDILLERIAARLEVEIPTEAEVDDRLDEES